MSVGVVRLEVYEPYEAHVTVCSFVTSTFLHPDGLEIIPVSHVVCLFNLCTSVCHTCC